MCSGVLHVAFGPALAGWVLSVRKTCWRGRWRNGVAAFCPVSRVCPRLPARGGVLRPHLPGLAFGR